MSSCDSLIQKAMRERAHFERLREEAALANPFTRPNMREQFSLAVSWYKGRSPHFFAPDGTRNSQHHGYWFWMGYDNEPWPLDYTNVKKYALHRAGRACRDAEGGLP